MSTVSLVKGDSKSNLSIALVREDTGAAYFAGSSAIVRLRIRKTGTTVLLNTSTATVSGSNYIFDLGTFLTLEAISAGFYEGEIEIEFPDGGSSTFQTIFEPVTLQVRDQFG
jgi:hypothetical protein